MRRLLAAWILTSTLLAGTLLARSAGAGVSGVFPPDPLGPADLELAQKLESIAEDLGIAKLATAGRASLILVDLPFPDSVAAYDRTPSGEPLPVHAAIAADTTLEAASISKLAILTAAYDAAATGELAITPDVRSQLDRMIRSSSNEAANRLIKILGFERIASALDNPRIALHGAQGGLWVGKDFTGPQASLWKAEPHSGQAHAASARSVARFYALLDRGELVSQEASAAMREILSVTTRNNKFVAGLGAKGTAEDQPVTVPGYRIYHKSGSYGRAQGDSALIEADGRRYILVCILDDQAGGEAKLRKLAARVDKMMAQRRKTSD